MVPDVTTRSFSTGSSVAATRNRPPSVSTLTRVCAPARVTRPWKRPSGWRVMVSGWPTLRPARCRATSSSSSSVASRAVLSP